MCASSLSKFHRAPQPSLHPCAHFARLVVLGLVVLGACSEPVQPLRQKASPPHASALIAPVPSTVIGDAVDIGTFGYGIYDLPLINGLGDVAGNMLTADHLVAGSRWTPATGLLQDLGSSECSFSSANGINASGVVAVHLANCPASAQYALTVAPDGLQRILSGGLSASAINDAGVVAGYGTASNPVQWDVDGNLTAGTFASSNNNLINRYVTEPRYINSGGAIAGQLSGSLQGGEAASVGFYWAPGAEVRELGSLGYIFGGTEVHAINKDGIVVGRSTTTDGFTHAFRWTVAGGMQDLGTLGGRTSWARGINDLGEIVGFSELANGEVQAFHWTASDGMRQIPMASALSSDAYGINNKGMITGEVSSLGEHGETLPARAFRWSPTLGFEDLGVLSGSGSRGCAINDAGQVAGLWFSNNPGGSAGRYALWTPADHPPVAATDGPYTGTEGAATSFSAAKSADVDGDNLSYSWDFGDGTPIQTVTTPTTSHSYADNSAPGIPYVVKVAVSDGRGGTDTARTTVTIANVPPVVNSGPDAAPTVKKAFTLTTTFSDAGTVDGPWAYVVDWGDGTPGSSGTSTTQPASLSSTHTYAATGTFTVTTTVTDKDGGKGTDLVVMKVSTNNPPLAVVSGPMNGVAGQPLSFSAAGSSDPDGDALTYTWAMGNGTTLSGPTIEYAYPAAGSYTISMTATDPFGAKSTASQKLRITANTTPLVTLTAGPPALAGSVTSLNGVVSDPDFGSGALLNAFILWGDGTTSRATVNNASARDGGLTFSASHTYTITSAQFYTAEVRVTDAYGATGIATVRMTAATPVRILRVSNPQDYQSADGIARISRGSYSSFVVFSGGTRSGLLQVIYLVRNSVTVGDNTGFEAPATCFPLRDYDGDANSDVMCSVTNADLKKAAPAGGVLTLNGTLNGPQYSNMPVQGTQ
jgi:probable HAF family extracellular repeat protein